MGSCYSSSSSLKRRDILSKEIDYIKQQIGNGNSCEIILKINNIFYSIIVSENDVHLNIVRNDGSTEEVKMTREQSVQYLEYLKSFLII